MNEQTISAVSSRLANASAAPDHVRPLQLLVVTHDQRLLKRLITATSAARAIQICGWVSAAEELAATTDIESLDIALIDFDMPLWASVGAIRHLFTQTPTVQIMAVFSAANTAEAMSAVRAGANACLLKEGQSGAQMTQALQALAAGPSTISPEIARQLVNAIRQPH